MTTAVLGLTELTPTTTERSTIIDAHRVLDAMWGRVASANININTPPTSPVDGTSVLIGSAPTGDFNGFAGHLALFIGTGWQFVSPALVGGVFTELGIYTANSSLDGWIKSSVGAEAVNEFTAAQVATPQVLTDATTVTIDCTLGNTFYLVLDVAGSVRLVNFSNIIPGTIVNLHIIQDATGNRTINWGSMVNWGNLSAPTLSVNANERDIVSFTGIPGNQMLGMPLIGGF